MRLQGGERYGYAGSDTETVLPSSDRGPAKRALSEGEEGPRPVRQKPRATLARPRGHDEQASLCMCAGCPARKPP